MRKSFGVLLVAALLATSSVQLMSAAEPAAAAAPGAVVLNELLYHPSSNDERAEFVELHNPGASAIDLGGWCLADGITGCFAPGTSIAAGGFATAAPDASVFTAKYGGSPALVYSGSLSNGGERIRLVDDLGTTIDAVTYSDLDPWPTRADGEGPSLERVDPLQSGDTPRNWRASTAGSGHTVRAVNTARGTGLLPLFTEATHTKLPAAGQAVAVSARLVGATSANLVYRIDFGAEVTVPFLDNGLSGDGAAGDGVFGASIPGQTAGRLVRYRLTTTGVTPAMTWPRPDDTLTYSGTTVAETISTALPVYQWFIDPVDYADALAHRNTDETETSVFAYGGTIIDNTLIHVRGQSSRSWAKPNWNFDFPQGHDFSAPGLLPVPVDSMNLQSGYSDKTYLREWLAWDAYRRAGVPAAQAVHVRVEQNNEFFGLFTYVEQPDDSWRARHGIDDDGAQYKANDDARDRGSASALTSYYEKKTRTWEDHSDLNDLLHNVATLTGTARHNYLMDHLDVAAVLDYLAVNNLIHNNDSPAKNYYLYRDTTGTGRWTFFPWDLDLTFGRNYNGAVLNDVLWANVDSISGRTNVSPSSPLFGDSTHQKYDFLWNRLVDAVFSDADLRAMYFRRLRTIMDQQLSGTDLEAQIDAEVLRTAPEAALDKTKWGQYGTAQTQAQAVTALKTQYLAPRRTHLFTTHRVAGEIPTAQSASPSVVVNEIQYRPAGAPNEEFVELRNNSATESVDLSGWTIEGVDVTIPAGTVLLPQRTVVFVGDDTAFRARYGAGHFVGGELGGELSDLGESLTLRDASGQVVDTVTYDDAAPWPTQAAGAGPSLELVDPTSDNALAASWAPSRTLGGTPGDPNNPAVGVPTTLRVNEVAPVGIAGLVDEAGDADPWLELYNAAPTSINLSGMYLGDALATPLKWSFPSGTELCGGCHLRVWADNEPGEGALHSTLAPTTVMTLSMPTGELVDSMTFPAVPAGRTYGSAPSGATYREVLSAPTPGTTNPGPQPKVVLNEYNGVSDTKTLANGGVDPFFGPVVGNGGDWFETVVVTDHVDLRGWQFVASDQTGLAGQKVVTLTVANDPRLADLRAGTIVTVSETVPDDLGYDPAGGDWTLNLQAAATASGVAITPAAFDVSNDNFQLTVKDASGRVAFGPAGEGVFPASGVGSDEVFKLEQDPSATVTPLSAYKDGTSSTFGAPNLWSSGTITQSFVALRSVASGPTVPTGLAVSGVTGTSVGLSWDASTDNVGVTGYRVFRDGSLVTTTSATSFTDTGLTDAHQYAYTVAAVDGDGNASATSGAVSATTADVTAPSAPTGLTVDSTTASSVSLSWAPSTDNVGVVGYRVLRNGLPIEDGVVATTSFTDTDTDLLPDTSYSYTVEAFDLASNSSAPSGSVSARTLADVVVPVTLVAAGSAWRYLDNGVDLGSGWRSPTFDDGAWKSGSAQFGYGEGDEATVVSFGPDPDKRYVTTYFRKSFTVADPSKLSAVSLGVLRDDGAVVYVNGVEVARSNMPAGAVVFKTQPDVNVPVADENTYFPFVIPATAFSAGSNTIAVELHQKGWSNQDLSFDLRLTANQQSTDGAAPSVPTGLAVSGVTGTSVGLSWDASTDDVGVTAYRIFRDGALVGTTSATSYTDTGLADAHEYRYEVAAVDGGGNASATSGAVSATTTDVTAPGAPTGLTVASVAMSSISLTWSPASDNVGVAGYRVRRDGVVVGTPTGTSFTDTDLLPDTSYSYTVEAFDLASNSSAPSGSVSARTLADVVVPVTLVAAGSAWRYLDNGVDLGSGWRSPTFDDGAWKSGSAQFGYGEGDEATVVSFGPDPDKRYVTTYFRKSFTVADPSKLSAVSLGVLRDDGAVVYVNGVEVARSNMPAGAVVFKTQPDVNVPVADENTYFPFVIPATAFSAGSNTIAVELHQKGWSNQDLSFDLRLTAMRSGTDDSAPPSVPAGLTADSTTASSVSLSWSPSVDDVGVAGYRVRRDGVVVGTPTGTSFTDTDLLPDTSYSYTVEAFDLASNSSAPSGSVSARTLADVVVPVTLVAAGSAWRYLDNGVDLGSGWRSPTFDDGAWKSGSAQFGYGEGDEATVVSFGPDPDKRYVTTYFRKSFTVADPSKLSAVSLGVLRDDGAVVYVNGVEVARSNMPAGAVVFKTQPDVNVPVADENTYFPFVIPATAFSAGSNTIAVELHQKGWSNQDLSFDLRLTADQHS